MSRFPILAFSATDTRYPYVSESDEFRQIQNLKSAKLRERRRAHRLLSLDTMNANELKVGSKVKLNGFTGTVVAVCAGQLAGMVEVRLPGGIACVDVLDVVAL